MPVPPLGLSSKSGPGFDIDGSLHRFKSRIAELESKLASLGVESASLDARLEQLRRLPAGGATVAPSSDPPRSSRDSVADFTSIRFIPFSSRLDTSFFREMSELKLSQWMLSETTVPIHGLFSPGLSQTDDDASLKCWFQLHETSFYPQRASKEKTFGDGLAKGSLLNVNTLESFKALDKNALSDSDARSLYKAMRSGLALDAPDDHLGNFTILTFADLKTHKFIYWFGGTRFVPGTVLLEEPKWSPRSTSASPALLKALSTYFHSEAYTGSSYFLVLEPDSELPRLLPLSSWRELSNLERDGVALGCVDPSSSDDRPGWTVQNMITLASVGMGMGGKVVKFVRLRDRVPMNLALAESTFPLFANARTQVREVWIPPSRENVQESEVQGSGWEPNAKGAMGPRVADLSSTMDPAKLATSAADLNLRLMKWRVMPHLALDRIASTRVLLLGSGTLGCSVARGLVGWGFRRITFVDQSNVAYSNPSRQNLFTVADVGRSKAEAAAEAVRAVNPSVVSKAVRLSIPMPGHESPEAHRDAHALDELIQDCDVVCLLTDTRESRWLPSLLGALRKKTVLNAALGFDSYQVMRHGGATSSYYESPGAGSNDKAAVKQLGCYFCSEFNAPRNSTLDRTLDQQCTVTRPGAAPIASALLVELLISLIHHPSFDSAPHDPKTPHLIRGYLSTFQSESLFGYASSLCMACSPTVVRAYAENGERVLSEALKDPSYLERLSGASKLASIYDASNSAESDDVQAGWEDDE